MENYEELANNYVKGFYKYLSREGKVLDNPFSYVTLPKKEKK